MSTILLAIFCISFGYLLNTTILEYRKRKLLNRLRKDLPDGADKLTKGLCFFVDDDTIDEILSVAKQNPDYYLKNDMEILEDILMISLKLYIFLLLKISEAEKANNKIYYPNDMDLEIKLEGDTVFTFEGKKYKDPDVSLKDIVSETSDTPAE